MKKITALILAIFIFTSANAADSNWKIHPTFDEEVTHVVETPQYVYFTSRQMVLNPSSEVYQSLFRYDKKGEELMSLSTGNLLSGNSVRDIIYNPAKGYLAVLYKDYNIDLLYNNGDVVNIPFYEQSNITQAKNVNSMAIDPKNDRLYLATAFGYVAVNDKKYEIAESRIYNVPFKAFCKVGDKYLAIKDNELWSIHESSNRLSVGDYDKKGPYQNPSYLYPLSDNLCLMIGGISGNQYVKTLKTDGSGISETEINVGSIYNIENTSNGVIVVSGNRIHSFNSDGSHQSIDRAPAFSNSAAATLNMTDVWNGLKRKGLSSVRKSGDQWNVSRDWMLPNSPATFITRFFIEHPSRGMMLLSYGCDPLTMNMFKDFPFQLNSYSKGRWTNYAPAYTNPDRANMLWATNGFAIDKNNSKYIYIASYKNCLARLNLDDPKDIIHISYPEDPDRNNEGFVVADFNPVTNRGWSNLTTPMFDKQGNLWMSYENWDISSNPKASYFCWLADDLKATTSASNLRQPKHVELDFYCPTNNMSLMIPLLKTGNGLMVHASFVNAGAYLAMYNTNGTPTDTKDDVEYVFSSPSDTDGNPITMGRIRCLWEDPETGYVWIGHQNGLCYFVPRDVIAGNFQLHKVKVSRNDGTNLADYLLEGVSVNQITPDADGRKWFATSGGGVICTTSDGRQILEEFNTSNSMLPDDMVFGIGFNSENNSLIFSTDQGVAEYYLPASQESATKTDVKAYPNPVRPEYSGYVTITDIPQGSLVKITDIKGNLVKELGVMSGFEMLWDISDVNFNRVKSGVYHIMVSPSDETSSYSAVGKILVVS